MAILLTILGWVAFGVCIMEAVSIAGVVSSALHQSVFWLMVLAALGHVLLALDKLTVAQGAAQRSDAERQRQRQEPRLTADAAAKTADAVNRCRSGRAMGSKSTD